MTYTANRFFTSLLIIFTFFSANVLTSDDFDIAAEQGENDAKIIIDTIVDLTDIKNAVLEYEKKVLTIRNISPKYHFDAIDKFYAVLLQKLLGDTNNDPDIHYKATVLGNTLSTVQALEKLIEEYKNSLTEKLIPSDIIRHAVHLFETILKNSLYKYAQLKPRSVSNAEIACNDDEYNAAIINFKQECLGLTAEKKSHKIINRLWTLLLLLTDEYMKKNEILMKNNPSNIQWNKNIRL